MPPPAQERRVRLGTLEPAPEDGIGRGVATLPPEDVLAVSRDDACDCLDL